MMRPYIKLPLTARTSPWSVPDLCAAYNWPRGLAGGGTIAIVELGGGWLPADNTLFFHSIGQREPTIVDVSVDGTMNSPGVSDADMEVALDIQVAAASYAYATGKIANIRVYWSDQDIAAGVRRAAADGCDVCSISWGADEAAWGRHAVLDMEAAAGEASAAGMLVFAASGDNDSADGGHGRANVDCPSCCPHVIGCGGTMKPHVGHETVWNWNPRRPTGEGTGGGFSTVFVPMPLWQANAPHGPGRMVPDLAANADPHTGYRIVVAGRSEVVGGTSAVSPLYSGLFAAFGKKRGWLSPKFYLNNVAFNDITVGDNGAFRASVGPDPCTGLGSPIGTRLAELFASHV